ncbi:MAG: SPOR domain-containing protein [Treponema sp.]
MDQKKTLWIVTASGVFLAVVILAALILNKPNPSSVPSTASIMTIERPGNVQPAQYDGYENTFAESAVDKSAVENLAPVDDIENNPSALQEELNQESQLASSDGLKSSDEVMIDLNQAAVQNTAVTPKNQAAAVAMETKKKGDVSSTIYTASKNEKTAAEIAAEKKAASLNSTQSTAKKVTAAATPVLSQSAKYWVQCASYASKKSADNARMTLDENRIPSEVFTYKDSKNTLYYRVRVGPYTTKSEAEYWKNRICQIADFKNSQSYITVN